MPNETNRYRVAWRVRCAIGAGLLIALAGWASWHVLESRQARHATFLARFKQSFQSGQVQLTAEPRIEERGGLRSGFALLSGANLYRVTAPFERDGKRLWGVWSYT